MLLRNFVHIIIDFYNIDFSFFMLVSEFWNPLRLALGKGPHEFQLLLLTWTFMLPGATLLIKGDVRNKQRFNSILCLKFLIKY